MSPFMRLFCCWFSFFLARGCFGSCRVVQCLVWFEVFFIHLLIFFNDLMKYNHGFFSPLFFLWDFLCLVSLRWGRFFCWMNWIVCWLSCRRICFFFYSNFFLMGLKKNFYSMKEVFYVSFFIYSKHGWGTNVKVTMQIFSARGEISCDKKKNYKWEKNEWCTNTMR